MCILCAWTTSQGWKGCLNSKWISCLHVSKTRISCRSNWQLKPRPWSKFYVAVCFGRNYFPFLTSKFYLCNFGFWHIFFFFLCVNVMVSLLWLVDCHFFERQIYSCWNLKDFRWISSQTGFPPTNRSRQFRKNYIFSSWDLFGLEYLMLNKALDIWCTVRDIVVRLL